MNLCNLCQNAPVEENPRWVSAEQFRIAIETGLRPQAYVMIDRCPPDMSLDEMYDAWIVEAMNTEDSWLLCDMCEIEVYEYLHAAHDAYLVAEVNALAQHAYERNQQYAGCEVISGFLTHKFLAAFFRHFAPQSGLPGELSGDQLSAAYDQYCQDNDLTVDLVTKFLEDIVSQPAHVSQQLATRILNRMQSAQDNSTTFRKLARYVSRNDEGLALAIASDDRFWTEQ